MTVTTGSQGVLFSSQDVGGPPFVVSVGRGAPFATMRMVRFGSSKLNRTGLRGSGNELEFSLH
jgi:hypothetical protein